METENTIFMIAKPMLFPEVCGDGYIDLVLQQDDLIFEIVVYIERHVEFEAFNVADIRQVGCCNINGKISEIYLLEFKDKVLDLMDENNIYSKYIEELGNVIGRYEPVKF